MKTQENQRFSKERTGGSEENIGSAKVALLWRMHVSVMLLKSSYEYALSGSVIEVYPKNL